MKTVLGGKRREEKRRKAALDRDSSHKRMSP
jgi:hypothetical protein